ncbi:MAG: hypothetical protein GX061_05805 [Eubacteriaceae bacterium]|nr:hypothetical protein [Eubacteriaceae bacterium]
MELLSGSGALFGGCRRIVGVGVMIGDIEDMPNSQNPQDRAEDKPQGRRMKTGRQVKRQA